MTESFTVRTIESEPDRQRLREFVAALRGARGLLAYEAHLARARYRTDFTIVVERDDALLGCALLRHTRWRLGGAIVDLALIERLLLATVDNDGALFEALIGAVLQTCAEQELPLVATAQMPELFLPIGFAPYRLRSELWLPAAPASTGTQRVSYALRPLNDRLDGPGDLDPLYAASYGAIALSEERVRPDWRSWLEAGQVAHILEDRREASIGYAVFDSEDNTGLCVVEAAVADRGVAHGMVSMLADHAAMRAASGLTLRLPPAHPLVRVALEHGGRLTVQSYDLAERTPIPLAGIVDLQLLLRQLSGELERRLAASRYGGWSGVLQFEIDGSRTVLAFEQGHSSLVDHAREHPDVLVGVGALGALAQLLLGYRSAADLRATGGIACEPTAFGLLDALFPVS